MAAGDCQLMAPVPASAEDPVLLARLSKLRVALRNADHATIGKDRHIRCLMGQLAAASTRQDGTYMPSAGTSEHKKDTRGLQQAHIADGDADWDLRMRLESAEAALDDERQVHAEESERLAMEAALARAGARAAARFKADAAAASAAAKQAVAALAESERDAATLHDEWRLRTEAAELRTAALQAQAASAHESQRRAAAEQRVQETALQAAEEQLRDARMLIAWQERRIAELERGDAHQAVRRLSAQLDAVRQRAAAVEAASRAEIVSLQLQVAQQPQPGRHAASTASECSPVRTRDAAQLANAAVACISSNDVTQDATKDDSLDAGDDPVAELLQALEGGQSPVNARHSATAMSGCGQLATRAHTAAVCV